MTRRKDKKQDERERMSVAMRRLEDLLQNPSPGITVTPAGETTGKRFQRQGEIDAPLDDLPGSMAGSEDSGGAGPDANVDAVVTTAAAADVAKGASQTAAGLGSPPKREPPIKPAQPKKGSGPQGHKSFKPAHSSGGFFGLFLSWLFGPRDG